MINNEKNKVKLSDLSKKDNVTFLMCSNCVWLRKFDHENLRIYCSKPKCIKKGDGEN